MQRASLKAMFDQTKMSASISQGLQFYHDKTRKQCLRFQQLLKTGRGNSQTHADFFVLKKELDKLLP